MKRNAMDQLLEWKNADCRQPVLLYGAKGTGKTYLAMEFAKTCFSQYLYVNFELNGTASDFFTKRLADEGSIEEAVSEYFQIEPEYLGDIVVIFDEISFCPELISAWNDEARRAYGAVTFASILISGFSPREECHASFEVIRLHPMGFDEFLTALSNEWYVDIIRGHYATLKPIPDIVHQELLALFEEYLIVGGFPMAVNEYIAQKSTINIGEIHKSLQLRMLAQASETFPEEAVRMTQIMKVLPLQLKRENKKFKYNSIRKGVTALLYKEAMTLLEQYGMVMRLSELEQKTDNTRLKLYLPDVGMLASSFLCEESDEIRKALVENYVMETLTQKDKLQLSFWESESQAKVDFLITENGVTTPVELRLNKNGKAKNITSYYTSVHAGEDAVKPRKDGFYYRFCFDNYHSTKVMHQLPLYSIFCI